MDIKQLNEEMDKILLYEMTKALSDVEHNITVWVENPNSHNNAYFKYFNSTDPNSATKVARIYIKKSEYVKGHSDRVKDWKLNSKEKKELIKILNAPYRKNSSITNWQRVITTFNDGFFNIDEEDTIKGLTKEQLQKGALPLAYPMPNYLEL